MIEPYKPLYKVEEAAQVLRTPKAAVYAMINAGEIPYFLVNGAKRVRGSDLEKFIEGHAVENQKLGEKHEQAG